MTPSKLQKCRSSKMATPKVRTCTRSAVYRMLRFVHIQHLCVSQYWPTKSPRERSCVTVPRTLERTPVNEPGHTPTDIDVLRIRKSVDRSSRFLALGLDIPVRSARVRFLAGHFVPPSAPVWPAIQGSHREGVAFSGAACVRPHCCAIRTSFFFVR